MPILTVPQIVDEVASAPLPRRGSRLVLIVIAITLGALLSLAVRDRSSRSSLPLALNAARTSLAVVGPERNVGGLIALAHAEFANHDFLAARDHAVHSRPSIPERASRTRF